MTDYPHLSGKILPFPKKARSAEIVPFPKADSVPTRAERARTPWLEPADLAEIMDDPDAVVRDVPTLIKKNVRGWPLLLVVSGLVLLAVFV